MKESLQSEWTACVGGEANGVVGQASGERGAKFSSSGATRGHGLDAIIIGFYEEGKLTYAAMVRAEFVVGDAARDIGAKSFVQNQVDIVTSTMKWSAIRQCSSIPRRGAGVPMSDIHTVETEAVEISQIKGDLDPDGETRTSYIDVTLMPMKQERRIRWAMTCTTGPT